MISQCRREKNNCYLSTWDVINGPESRKNCCLWSKVTTFTAMSLPTTFFTVRYSLYTLFLQIWKSYRNDIKQKNRALWQDGTKNKKLPLKNTLKKRYVVAPVLILLHFNSKSWRISWGTCHFFLRHTSIQREYRAKDVRNKKQILNGPNAVWSFCRFTRWKCLV